jgi:hypothetical protein
MKVVYGPTTETRVVGAVDRITRLERRPQLYDIVEEMKICDDVTAIDDLESDTWKWEASGDLVGLDIVQVKIYVTDDGGADCTLTNKGTVLVPRNDLVCTLSISGGGSDTAELEDIDETNNDIDGVAATNKNDRLWLAHSGSGLGLGLIVTYGRDWRP